MEEMFPRPSEPYLQPQKQSAWLEKAKGALTSEKKIEPFHFTAEVRVFDISISIKKPLIIYLCLSHASKLTTSRPLVCSSTRSITLSRRIGYLRSSERKRV
jgi:hypothetical protein